MPTRTELPTVSITCRTMSSPSMTFSPGRRVMMSMGAFLLGNACRNGARETVVSGGLLLDRGLGEQRGADGGVLALVDHLVATTVGDKDGSAQVRGEALELRGGAHGHPDVDCRGVFDAEPGGLRLVDVDGEVREEQPGVGDRQGQIGIFDRLQPGERRRVVGGEQGVAGTTEADQAGGELDDGLALDLEGPEAGALEGHGGHGWRTPSGFEENDGYTR